MTNEATRNKLIEMHLSAMAKAFDTQLDDPGMLNHPFEDRFGLLVDRVLSTQEQCTESPDKACRSQTEVRKCQRNQLHVGKEA